jgi:hypothetical protein
MRESRSRVSVDAPQATRPDAGTSAPVAYCALKSSRTAGTYVTMKGYVNALVPRYDPVRIKLAAAREYGSIGGHFRCAFMWPEFARRC